MKILAIQFKYFGDAVMVTPALRALHDRFPEAALHMLAPREVAPVFQHLPCLARVWPMERVRGRAGFRENLPLVLALRAEHFDRSVDFGGNDRGAVLSFLCGARERLGPKRSRAFLGHGFCYNHPVPPAKPGLHEARRLLHLLTAWGIESPEAPETEIRTNPVQDSLAAGILPGNKIICHIASSQPKKEWPLRHWAELYSRCAAAGRGLVFGTGLGPREQSLMAEFKRLAPAAEVLPPIPDLGLYLAVIKRAAAFVSGDTGPLHFAAALGVPTLALFGPTPAEQWRPLGQRHQVLLGGGCACDGNTAVCRSPDHCLSRITPAQVLDWLQKLGAGAQKD